MDWYQRGKCEGCKKKMDMNTLHCGEYCTPCWDKYLKETIITQDKEIQALMDALKKHTLLFKKLFNVIEREENK